MSNGTQLWPGERMRAFFRAHILRETQLDAAAADRLAQVLTRAVNRMMVWDATGGAIPDAKPPTSQTRPPFNPYAFSAMVTLARSGRDGLMKKLAEIRTADELKTFADAQHLAIDRGLKKSDELRRAIVAATEQRLADRKAAAS
jgi:hypothetical protein